MDMLEKFMFYLTLITTILVSSLLNVLIFNLLDINDISVKVAITGGIIASIYIIYFTLIIKEDLK